MIPKQLDKDELEGPDAAEGERGGENIGQQRERAEHRASGRTQPAGDRIRPTHMASADTAQPAASQPSGLSATSQKTIRGVYAKYLKCSAILYDKA